MVKRIKNKKLNLEIRDKVFLLIGIILFILIIVMIYFGLIKKSKLSAIDISKKFKKEIVTIKSFKKVDPDKIAGNKHEYISKTYIYDDDISYSSDDFLEASASIEVFKTDVDAKMRYDYLIYTYKLTKKYIPEKKFGVLKLNQVPTNYYLYLKDNVLLRINENSSNVNVTLYKKTLDKILRKNKFDKITYSDSELKKFKNNKSKKIEDVIKNTSEEFLKQLNDELEKILTKLDDCTDEDFKEIEKNVGSYSDIPIIKDKYNEVISKIKNKKQKNIDDINNKISSLYSSLNKQELDNLKLSVEKLTDDYYKEYKNDWDNKIKEIEEKISEKQRQEEAVRRQEELARKNRTFSNGFYEVGRDIEPGTYDLIAISSGGNVFIYDAFGSLKVNEIMGTRNSSLYSKTYNNVYLGSGYRIEIKNGVTIKFQAK